MVAIALVPGQDHLPVSGRFGFAVGALAAADPVNDIVYTHRPSHVRPLAPFGQTVLEQLLPASALSAGVATAMLRTLSGDERFSYLPADRGCGSDSSRRDRSIA